LNTLKIKPFYNTLKDNIITDFYIPVLSRSKIYKRVSAYFDSNIFTLYSKGIENIVNNNGHIFFIFSKELNSHDYNIIVNGYSERNRIFEDMKNQILFSNPDIEIQNLGYLIKNNFVDIKIAFTHSTGIFHDKFGICENDDNIIYFRGSNNETVASIQSNFESFETTCSWNSNEFEKEKIMNAQKMFDDLWSNTYSSNVFTLDIPDVIKNQLISYASNELILTNNSLNNTAILDFNNQLILINRLETKEYLDPKYSFYKRVIEPLIETNINDTLKFQKSINYLIIKNVIKELIDYSKKVGFSVFLTDKLHKYINDKDILIEKRRSLGIAIKERLSILTDQFSEFSQVVNANMIRKLREPQMWDAFHIAKMRRSANFSVPGAGKTSIVYGAFAYLEKNQEVDKIVMIGPINSFSSWKDEFKLCFGEYKKLVVFDYQQQKFSNQVDRFDSIAFGTKGCNLILINYESLPGNLTSISNIIDDKTLLVFDEVHRIKSIEGKRAISALNIGNLSNYRVVLTGTPIPNGYVDIYNMFNILFKDEYDTYFGYTPHHLNNANYNTTDRTIINNSIYPFFCRTSKHDLDVPNPEPDQIITIKSNENESKLFDIIYRAFGDNVLHLFIRLIQASNNPSLLLKALKNEDLRLFNNEDYSNEFTQFDLGITKILQDDEVQFIKSIQTTSKFNAGIDLTVKLVKNGKVLVWGIFIDTLSKIKETLLSRGVKANIISGATPLEERNKIIDDFKNGDLEVLITNPHTLGESVSLHKACHQAVYFEYSFNLVHLLQSKDRIHRLGLEKNDKTFYYFLQLKDESIFAPIDSKIYNRLKEKEQLQLDAINNKEIIYNRDNIIEDIENLFKGIK